MAQKFLSFLIEMLIIIAVTEVILFVLKKIRLKSQRAKTVLTLIRSLIRYAAGIAVVCLFLDALGFDPKTIAASVGILTLIIGFSAESLISDVVTGIFMVFENQYNVGDILEVADFRGTVTDIGIRTTSLMDTGGNIKIINNSEMVNILNRSDKFSVAVTDLKINAGKNLEAIEKKLPAMMEDIREKNPQAFATAPRYLGIEAIDGNAVTLRFIAEVPEKEIYSAQRLLNHELLIRFLKEGIELS